jgi:hypothetical protein
METVETLRKELSRQRLAIKEKHEVLSKLRLRIIDLENQSKDNQ